MRLFVIFLLCFSVVFAKSDKISTIPPVKNIVINLSSQVCDLNCMEKLLDEGKIFSFLGYYNLSMDELNLMSSEYEYYKKIFRLFDGEKSSIKIALLVPQKSIRRYAVTTVNSVLAYLMSKQNYFELEVFNSMYEDENSIIKQIEQIKEKGFKYVIAPFTQRGAEVLVKNADGLIVYIPTVNKNKVNNSPSNIFFGGIDYKKQISELLKYSNEKIAYFSDDSFLSNSLNDMLKENTQQIIYSKNINSSKINFKKLFKDNKLLQNSSIFMNIPLVKASLIASQLRYYDIQPYAVLSTQINYNPMLLTLTQYDDRKNFFIANSIGKTTVSMEELNSIFGNDIVYDWVNYSTALGIDYVYNTYFMEKSESFFQEQMNDGQVEYSISIVQPKRYSFEKIIF